MCCCASSNVEILARYVGLHAHGWSIFESIHVSSKPGDAYTITSARKPEMKDPVLELAK